MDELTLANAPALPFTVLDVFTETPFKGNPLAVVTIPLETSLSQSQKQLIAREFNLSETVFIHDVKEPQATQQRRYDIFTRTAEIPFAGHPTIGTAACLYRQGVRTLIAKAGPVNIEALADGSYRAAIPHNTRLHGKSLPAIDKSLLPESHATIAEAEAGSPLFAIVNGMTFALIKLPSVHELGVPEHHILPEHPGSLLDEGWRNGWVTRRYYYVEIESDVQGASRTVRLRTRMLRLTSEDPATGSAACALAAYLSLHQYIEPSINFTMVQGVEMGRESHIVVHVDVRVAPDGQRELKAIYLGGKAVPISTGNIIVPK